jgi:glycosyltransferase involved in cell wall biosynthesis
MAIIRTDEMNNTPSKNNGRSDIPFQATPVVVHIAPTPFFANRGCHIRIENEIRALSVHPYRIVVVTYHHGRDPKGIDIRRIAPIPGYTKTEAGYSPFKFLADILLFFKVLSVCRKERPIVLHGHLHEGALIGWAVRSCLIRPRPALILDMQGSLSGELSAYGAFSGKRWVLRVFEWIEGRICRMVDQVLCSSLNAFQCLKRFTRGRVSAEILADMVPDRFFEEPDRMTLRRRLGIDVGQNVLIYTGGLLPAKGLNELMEAVRILLETHGDLVCILAGYPTDRVRETAHRYGWADRCRIPGEISYDVLSDWLGAADVAIDPKPDGGAQEASGKIVHYMASGIPVVCFDSPSNRTLLGDAGYYADKAHGPLGLVRAVEKVFSDTETARKKGRLGKQRAQEIVSPGAVGKRLADVYHHFEKDRLGAS